MDDLPQPSGLPRIQDPRTVRRQGRPYDAEAIKTLVEGAMFDAMNVFVTTLHDPEAKPSEKLKAAEVIVNYGTGAKASPFSMGQTEKPIVEQLSDLLQQVRNPEGL